MAEPREYTAEEVQEKFLRHVWMLIDYWEKEKGHSHDAMTGLAFSILSTIDGSSMELPGFMLIPVPHEDDKEYHIGHGERWFRPYRPGDEELCDAGGGSLHELFYKFDPERG